MGDFTKSLLRRRDENNAGGFRIVTFIYTENYISGNF